MEVKIFSSLYRERGGKWILFKGREDVIMEVRKENEKFEKRIVNKRFVIVIIMINL